jgi:hypothetical protein
MPESPSKIGPNLWSNIPAGTCAKIEESCGSPVAEVDYALR